MADMTAPSGQAPAVAPPVRTDEEIVPHIRWVPIGKSNCSLDLEKKAKQPYIQNGASYYQEYQANVAKHRSFIAGETGSAQDSPTPKPAKPTRKPKPTAQKARINIL
nr:hypothetical protein [Tanacetum cinerariifolium]